MNVNITIASLLLALGLAAGPAFAAEGTGAKHAEDMTPTTAQGHLELAKKYEAKAGEYKAEADHHRKMLAEYEKDTPPQKKKLGRDQWLEKMKTHCSSFIKNAEALQQDAKAFADFHRMRAKEMEGK